MTNVIQICLFAQWVSVMQPWSVLTGFLIWSCFTTGKCVIVSCMVTAFCWPVRQRFSCFYAFRERKRESSKQKTFRISNIFFRTYSKDTKKSSKQTVKKKSQLIYKGKHSTLNVSNQERMELDKGSHSTSNLSKETLKSSKEWNDIF